ncbi:MAG: exopolysaccharide biosynthesis polyprenyl glycosylphosphotransferase [Lachnospiraceae bacterium]|nr:exopolysaccharide biosynthesis polyprenyl glycosylphosphotransferase [Lachnospiraceae bacterium]
MNKKLAAKRMIMLFLNLIGLMFETGVYAYLWFNSFYPSINHSNTGLKFFVNGHILIIFIYFVLLYFFTSTYGGLKVGYLKPMDVIISQIVAAILVNIITYAQLSLMNNWLLPVRRFFLLFFVQTVIIILWTLLCNVIYHRVYPPRQILLVHGDRPYEDIVRKFNSRSDKFNIARTVNVSEGIENICDVIEKEYRTVLLWDLDTYKRNRLLKFCYSRSIRVYMMPKIPDVLIKGSDAVHLFDTPLLLIGEHALTVEQRATKRLIDLILSIILIVLTSPVMLITAIVIKLYDRGPVLYKQVRCTAGGKEFKILKFRSMKVDAEKDGVARLASKNDSRITPIGKFIRSVRIDELPQLFNIFIGDMSFIGPRPERPEIIEQYSQKMPEFVFRMKMKAGLAGYAQVYGKYNTTPYDKLKLDLTYIENYSVWLDLKLMLLTLKILIKPESTEGVESSQTTAMKNPSGEKADNE